MGESDTQRRQEFVNTIDKLAEKLYPPTDEASNRARREYLHGGFWSYFDPTHVYYSPALPGFDNGIAASPDTISYECESESSDSSDWGGPFVDIELEKRMKQRYDNFWRNAGFKL
jgi:hypothetical protein